MVHRPRRYLSDTSDEQWAVIEPLLPQVNTGGRPEKHPRRAIVDAILYAVRDGVPRNAGAAHLHGFLSRDGLPPAELARVGRDDVTRYGGEVVDNPAQAIERGAEKRFLVRLAAGAVLTTRAVLVATGLRDELPEVAGLRERWGKDVLHCPYCHGYEVRDMPLGVVGGENRPFTLHQALLVRQWSEDVVFFPNRIELAGEERERLVLVRPSLRRRGLRKRQPVG